MEITYPFFAAVLASMLHVISGPDHLAAVTPLAIESEKKAWKVGLSWGLGHILGMLLIGVLFLAFKDYIPIKSISENSEKLVGIVLIGIGLWSFIKLFKETKSHKHPHIHTEESPYIHIHKHDHGQQHAHSHSHQKKKKQNLVSSFSVGFLHGLAGVAHFILLIPVLGFKTLFESVQYIVGFGVGTILAMTAYAIFLSVLTEQSKQLHNEMFFKGIRLSGGLFATIIGIYWLLFA